MWQRIHGATPDASNFITSIKCEDIKTLRVHKDHTHVSPLQIALELCYYTRLNDVNSCKGAFSMACHKAHVLTISDHDLVYQDVHQELCVASEVIIPQLHSHPGFPPVITSIERVM